MTDRLHIVADTPSDDPRLGFEAYAEALAAAIRGGEPAQFTIGIYGSWGSGKSSLLNAIDRRFDGDEVVIAVKFDAWRYERAEHIAVPLLHAVHRVLAERDEQELLARVGKALTSLVRGMKLNFGIASLDLDRVSGGSAAVPDNLSAFDAAFTKPYADMRLISESLGDRRIVVLVDDLDRCSPAKVVGVLEAINLVLDVPGFIFVLALDYEVLVEAVATRYPHASGHVFIEKMIQVPFRVPRLSLTRETFLDDLIPDWESRRATLPRAFGEIAFDVCTLGLNANPRQIKRFINSVYVLSAVAESTEVDVDLKLLAGVVGLQLGWPAEYQDVSDSVLAEDAEPLASLFSADDPTLPRYATMFFKQVDIEGGLRTVLTLTQSVGTPETSFAEDRESDVGGAEELRQAHRAVIESQFESLMIETSPRYRNTYYHKAISGCRIKFGKTVVRFEARSKEGRWLLVQSFLLTKQHQLAIDLLVDNQLLRQAVRMIGKRSSVPSNDPVFKKIAALLEPGS